MKRTGTWQERMIGNKLPKSLLGIDWRQVTGGRQEYGDDPFGNDWRKEGGQIWTTVTSEYREAIYLPVFLTVDSNDVVTDVEIQAYASYGPSHGRPAYVEPQRREQNQVGRFIKSLYKAGLK